MEHNNLYDWHLCFSPYFPVLQSKKLKIEQLFLHFFSIRTNKYKLNQSATYISYCVPSLTIILFALWLFVFIVNNYIFIGFKCNKVEVINKHITLSSPPVSDDLR